MTEKSQSKPVGPIEQQKIEILRYADEGRRFEIGLFWQRSLFFWGFIGSSFIAFAAMKEPADHEARMLVICFGFVCSVAWTLLNRGSKYWQEAWEQKAEIFECDVLGFALFSRKEKIIPSNIWLDARRFSVSKLSIALSDFTVLVWIGIAYSNAPRNWWHPTAVELFLFGGGWAVLMLVFCRSNWRVDVK